MSKHEAEDTFVVTQVGSFYEIYLHHAERLGPLLNLTMTSRAMRLEGDDRPSRRPFCGFPLAQLDRQIAILVQQHRHKIALYEEHLIYPFDKGSRVRRLKRIYTPGTLVDEAFVPADGSNYICAIVPRSKGNFGICWADLTTGELVERHISLPDLVSEMAILRPSEFVLLPSDHTTPIDLFGAAHGAVVSRLADSPNEGSLGMHGPRALLAAYVRQCLPSYSVQLGVPINVAEETLRLDSTAVATLELLRGQEGGALAASLFRAVRRTRTSGGARALQRRLCYPSTSSAVILDRLDQVEFFFANRVTRLEVNTLLARFPDVSRVLARIKGAASFKDVFALGLALQGVSGIASVLRNHISHSGSTSPPALRRLDAEHQQSAAALSSLDRAISDCQYDAEAARDTASPRPLPIERDGTIVPVETDEDSDSTDLGSDSAVDTGFHLRPSFAPALQEAHDLHSDLVDQRARLLLTLQGLTSTKTDLVVDRKIGPLVKVSASKKSAVPGVILKTLRSFVFVSHQPWHELHRKLVAAREAIAQIEQAHLDSLYARIKEAMPAIEKAMDQVHEIDVAAGFAALAEERGYTRPTVDESHDLIIEDGRHPVVEQKQPSYQSTSLSMEAESSRFLVVTGPNMAGKSTNLRQAALIVILAQAGSFVPARFAKVGVVDRIYTRIGAQDNLASGTSTFMQEMTELGAILHGATPRALVLLDAFGRGTAPSDGVAISYAAAKHLLARRSRTIFATHLHAVCDLLEEEQAGHPIAFRQTAVAVDEATGAVRFDYELKDGISRDSQALVTAKLAGVPDSVLEAARDTLAKLNAATPAAA